MSELTCWALLREAKVEHDPCLNVTHCGYLLAITHSTQFKWNQASTSVLKWRSLYRKITLFSLFFYGDLLLMHRIKLIHRDLAHVLSKARCLPSTIVRLLLTLINVAYFSIPVLIVIKLSNLSILYLYERPDLNGKVSPSIPFSSHICGSKIRNLIKFYFLSFSLHNVEVFYWCGEKQWGQGRALWWQKCIFNACEWMSPHIPQQQALHWMAAVTWLFSLLITALCLLTMDRVIFLPQMGGGSLPWQIVFFKEILLTWIWYKA